MKKNSDIFRKKSKGIAMMEALISIGLVALLVMSVYSVLSGVVRNIGDSKQRIGALALGNEKMEIFRNLPYAQIGTVDGIVPGPVVASETTTRNGFNYTVFCQVRYVDDVLDGFFPEDVIDTDYKRVSVEIQWSNGGKSKKINFYNNFVPDGLETNVGGGTLSINAVDYSGEAVSGVSVNIASVEDDPAIDFNAMTDNYGNLILPGVPSQNYRVSLTKEGYENITTYPNPPGSVFIPIDPDIFIEAGALNTKTFYINPAGKLTFSTVKMEDDSAIADLSLNVRGGRIIGASPETFSFNETLSLGGDGSGEITSASLGEYFVDNTGELDVEGYQYITSSQDYPVGLAAGEEKSVSLLFADENINSLVVVLRDEISAARVEGAEIVLSGEGFTQQRILTNNEGVAYFPLGTDPVTILAEGPYHFQITKEGYVDYSEDVTISQLVKKEINLTPEIIE